MKYPNSTFVFCLLLLCDGLLSYGQQPRPISLDLKQASMETLVGEIEKQSPYRFYFDPRDTDAIRITLSVTQANIDSVLNLVLAPHQLFFSIDFKFRVFIASTQKLDVQPIGIDTGSDTEQQYAVKRPPSWVQTNDTLNLVNKLVEIGLQHDAPFAPSQLYGYVTDANSGMPLKDVTVSIEYQQRSVRTDRNGYYAVTVPTRRTQLVFMHEGKTTVTKQVLVHASGRLDIDLMDEPQVIDEVVVTAEQMANVRRTQLGLSRVSMQEVRTTPVVFGEADIVRVILTLPGVQTVGESSSGFNVRGGATDQNLVLFNGSTIYNPSHFFGFFSAFNPDAVAQVQLYKSSIPARFGGRLSSVLDITGKTGNREKFSGSGGIGLLTSRLTLEGPIADKTTFLVSGRSTYSDWLLKLIPDERYKNSRASFYDSNVKLLHRFDTTSVLQVSGYLSKDRFLLADSIGNGYRNQHANIKWDKHYSEQVASSIQVGVDHYLFHVEDQYRDSTSYRFDYAINQFYLKGQISHRVGRHQLSYGLDAIHYRLRPGTRKPTTGSSLIEVQRLPNEFAMETALFLSDQFKISDQLTLDAGLRYSMYNFVGPTTVRSYATGVPKGDASLIGQQQYGSGALVKTYHGPEFRVNLNYSLSQDQSVKVGFNTLQQYIHMLSNTTSISPTDTWKLSDAHIKPQQGGQATLGYYRNWRGNAIEASIEGYYKYMDNYLDYKGGAVLLMNDAIEQEVVGTQGRAYGVELLMKKNTGRLNGWFSYTYSKVEQRTLGKGGEELINNGAYYPANFDKPHSVNLVTNYRFSHRVSFSFNLTYSTGRPITVPIGKFYYAGSERVYYSERNQYRIPDYFRTDAAFNFEGSHRIKKLAHSSWSVGVYNMTGRRNPFSVYFVSEEGKINGYRFSVFGNPIPYVSYNFRF